jgi:hypothetical protein
MPSSISKKGLHRADLLIFHILVLMLPIQSIEITHYFLIIILYVLAEALFDIFKKYIPL